jgi:hypothetical protein
MYKGKPAPGLVAFVILAGLAFQRPAEAAPIITTDPVVVAAFQSGATVQNFDAIGGRTPLAIAAYTGGLAIPAGALLYDELAGVRFTVGGSPGDSRAVLLSLTGGIAGDATSPPTVLGPATMEDQGTQETDFQNAFMEMIFDTKVNRVGFWLNPSLGNVLILAFDAFAGTELESIPNAPAGSFVGFQRALNDIGAISIVPLGSGFTIDDLTYGTTQVTPPPPVPEPGVLALLGCAAVGFLRRAAHRRSA